MRDNGEAIDVRIQGRVAREPDGELVLYAVVSDVTAELRDQRERSWQNERYRLLSEMTHKMSFDYDSDSDTVLLYMDRTGKGMEARLSLIIWKRFRKLAAKSSILAAWTTCAGCSSMHGRAPTR